ncbi:cg30 [Leucania separata nucleopolyhedrovirus]|uniref:Cg30 n=1 Tax=Leucania separata nucleopolyhedrovirus TaxID=1307956 RepID=Q0IL24_NPVLS|nr:cg30 [Leucania separata nucleopolyhedrovirus]AAR28859.1 cg30 [Leucania separata nucleopolyhedrovirus]
MCVTSHIIYCTIIILILIPDLNPIALSDNVIRVLDPFLLSTVICHVRPACLNDMRSIKLLSASINPAAMESTSLDCSICLTSVTFNQADFESAFIVPFVKLSCDHAVCVACTVKLFETNASPQCPICRNRLKKLFKVHGVYQKTIMNICVKNINNFIVNPSSSAFQYESLRSFVEHNFKYSDVTTSVSDVAADASTLHANMREYFNLERENHERQDRELTESIADKTAVLQVITADVEDEQSCLQALKEQKATLEAEVAKLKTEKTNVEEDVINAHLARIEARGQLRSLKADYEHLKNEHKELVERYETSVDFENLKDKFRSLSHERVKIIEEIEKAKQDLKGLKDLKEQFKFRNEQLVIARDSLLAEVQQTYQQVNDANNTIRKRLAVDQQVNDASNTSRKRPAVDKYDTFADLLEELCEKKKKTGC